MKKSILAALALAPTLAFASPLARVVHQPGTLARVKADAQAEGLLAPGSKQTLTLHNFRTSTNEYSQFIRAVVKEPVPGTHKSKPIKSAAYQVKADDSGHIFLVPLGMYGSNDVFNVASKPTGSAKAYSKLSKQASTL